MHELLVEIAAQPRQFVGVAQLGGCDHLIELRRPRLVVERTAHVREGTVRADRLHAFLAIVTGLAVDVVHRLVALLLAVAFLVLLLRLFAARLDFALAVLALVVAFVALVLLLLVGALVLGAAFVALLGDLIALDQFEFLQHLPR